MGAEGGSPRRILAEEVQWSMQRRGAGRAHLLGSRGARPKDWVIRGSMKRAGGSSP